MPYNVVRGGGDRPYKIKKKSTGKVVGTSKTKKDAMISVWKRSKGD
jgi:hypothetical protein